MSVLKSVMPVLKVREMDSATRFYTRELGFSVAWRSPGDGGGENCMLESGRVAVLLSTGSQLGSPPRFTGTIYFEVGDVDGLWEKFGRTADVVWPISDMDYGTREFGIRDPDGYVLAFAEQRGSRSA
jgi:catechol 2,3-dioxygenase-like lactoylglutathione lyase family enzyme